MTRINLVPPAELTDQHLFAEWREIKIIPKSLRRSLEARGADGVLDMVPPTFRLGKGHVSFFYDKGLYLSKRYNILTEHLRVRGIYDYDVLAQFDADNVYNRDLPAAFFRDYTPTPEALAEVRKRIHDRIQAQPNYYRMWGSLLT